MCWRLSFKTDRVPKEGSVSKITTWPCPHCNGVGIWFEYLTDAAYVDYYRCFSCANVWTVSRDTSKPTNYVIAKMAIDEQTPVF